MQIFSSKEIDQVANGISQFLGRYRNRKAQSVANVRKLSNKKRKSQSKNWGKWKKRR
ncbi:hypothetical protein M3689_01000 [Alkalihalophilus marmarensis]|uniref:hypothetical protein n=1 Tax=Alkalihalophilus marmarensis TaxID=521377 RepID=UPI00203F299C|nr:hypothetical protein [Alkalihalophilus marmarensis]MCM3487877.1 hypothetical protein [Alkalihalophilus marmarensis]